MSVADRRERVRADLSARNWGGVLATPSVNFTYLTGAPYDRSERLACLGIPKSGEPWIVCPSFEEERLAGLAPGIRIVPWEETDDPFRIAVAEIMAQPGTWALEPTTAYHDATRLAAAAPGLWLADGAAVFEKVRRAKEPGEIAALERAIGAAWKVYDTVVAALTEGVTEAEVAKRMGAEFAALGYEGWSLIQFGPSAAVPHGEAGSRRLERGMAVLIDWGGWGEGFTADLTRSFWWDGGVVPVDQGPEEYRRVHGTVRAAQEAGLRAAAPGILCGEVDRAARSVIEAAGWGQYFTHRLGHGLGREIHEAPYLVSGSTVALAPGDVATFEPGIYLPGKFGVRWEDDVLVTEDGIRNLSRRAGEEMS